MLDYQFRVFGAKRGSLWGHGYEFNKTISEHAVDTFQRQNQIELPADYREFITQIGDGGAGPHYGIKSVADAAKYSDLPASFPWSSEITLDSDSDFGLWETLPGVLVIAERGCGYSDVFVVNGIAKGQIWSDFTAVDCPLSPTHGSFTDWYVEWAERCIATIKREPLIDQIQVGMSVDEVRDVLGADMSQWTGKGNLPDSPAYYIGFKNTNASFSIGEDHKVQKINKMNQI